MTLWQNEKNAKKMPTFFNICILFWAKMQSEFKSQIKRIYIIKYIMTYEEERFNEQSVDDARQEDKNYENEYTKTDK